MLVQSHRVIFMSQLKYLAAAVLLLSACAQTPPRAEPADHDETAASVDATESVEQDDETAALPNVELSREIVYEFLLSEIGNQRGYKALAVEGSFDLARKTRDPRLAKRAAQLAFELGDLDKAIAAFKIWQEVDPATSLPTRMLSSLLMRGNRLDEARTEFARVLREDPANAGQIFLQIYQLAASHPDRLASLQLMQDLAAPYPQVAEAHWAVAQLARASGDDALAMSEVRVARSLRAEWDMAVSLEAQLLGKSEPQRGLEVLRYFLADYPKSREIRLQYARALLEQKKYKPARDEFQRLADDNPASPDMAFAIALISLQLNDLEGAEAQLKQALSKGKKDQDTVQYYLGQLSEAKKNEDEAVACYRRVQGGEHLFSAQVRIAYLLNKRGKLEEARKTLHQMTAADNQQRVQLLMIEAQLLREANQLPAAYQVLQQGLAKLPNHPDLLYETAMLADKLGKHQIAEQNLRKLIALQPTHAHAYNALGFSLLERNERIAEAVELVEKALQLAPDDFAIMDSVGWGYYRSGKLDDSVKMLRRAYEGNPDPEIASHLGEVLWVRGDKTEARKIWHDSLRDNPGNAQLQAVMKLFMP